MRQDDQTMSDLFDRRTGGVEDGFSVLQDLFRLIGRVVRHQLARLRIDADLPGEIQHVVDLNGLAERSDGCGSILSERTISFSSIAFGILPVCR